MSSLQEHLDETRRAQERVDEHLTKRSATESSILKEVLSLVALYGKLGEAVERIEGKLDRILDSEEEEQEPDLFAKTVNLKASLPGAYVTTSWPDWPKHTFSDDDYDPELKRWIWRGKEYCGCRNCTLARRMTSRDLESEDPAEWERQERLSSELGALNERFASYKPYGPPPGFPDEDESYGDAS